MLVQVIGREDALNPLKEELKQSPNQASSWYYILGRSSTGKTLALETLRNYAWRLDVAEDRKPLCIFIDFQDQEILFIEGLLDAIVSGLRAELHDENRYFVEYDNALARLIEAERDYLMPKSRATLLDKVYEAFRDDYHSLAKRHRVMLLFDTMEQFDKEYLFLKNDAVRKFFREKILALHGTTFVMSGRSHHEQEATENLEQDVEQLELSEYTWYSNGESGMRPSVYGEPNQSSEMVIPRQIKVFQFSDFDLSDIRLLLWTTWDSLSQNEKESLIDEEILSHIKEGDELAQNALAKVLKHPLKLSLFAEHFMHSPYFNLDRLPESTEDIEFMLVQSYYELAGLSDVIMYAALKDYGFDQHDLMSIMRIDDLSARQKLKALHNHVFVKHNSNGTLTLHDDMRHLINTHIWNAYDMEYGQRRAIYEILLDRYQDQFTELQKTLAVRIKRLQNEPSSSPYDILNHSLESLKDAHLDDLAVVGDSDDSNWGYHLPPETKGLISSKKKLHNREVIRMWMDIQHLQRREKIIAHEMHRIVQRLDRCKKFERKLRLFETEWHLAWNHQPDLLQTITDSVIDKMIDCEYWEQIDDENLGHPFSLRDFNFRVIYRQGRNLEQSKQYDAASEFYEIWLAKIAERKNSQDVKRRISLLVRQAMVYANHPKPSLKKATEFLDQAWNLCQNYPGVAQSQSDVAAKYGFICQLQSLFDDALDWYKQSIQLLEREEDGQRLRYNLMLNLVQSGYVQRYKNPRIGIEQAQVGYTFFVRERLDYQTALSLHVLAILHRRNGDYEESFRYALQCYKLARTIDNKEVSALATIELAVTRWYAVANVRGTDAKQSYIDHEPLLSNQKNANMKWTLHHLQQAYEKLDGQLDNYVMNLEFLRLSHLMIRAYIETENESEARRYLALTKTYSEKIDDFFRSQQLCLDELRLEFTFDPTLTYEGFTNLAPYKVLIINAKYGLSSHFVGNAHHLAGRIAQRYAMRTDNDELYEKAINHYMQAYIYLAKQPKLGTLNLQQDWRLLQDRIQELELSEEPQVKLRRHSMILDWCERLRKALRSSDENWVLVKESYPQLQTLVKIIEIRQHLMTLQMNPVDADEDIYQQLDTYIARRQYAQAWRIIVRSPVDDYRIMLRKVEVLSALERIKSALTEFHILQDALSLQAITLNTPENIRMEIQQAVLEAYYVDDTDSESKPQLKQTLDRMYEVVKQLDTEHIPDVASICYFRFGDILQHFGYYYPALNYFDEAMRLYVELENPIAAADCLLHSSRLYSLVGNYEMALWYADQGTFFMSKLKHHEGIVNGYTALGIAYRAWAVYAGLRGAPGTLLQHYQQARYYMEWATKNAEELDCRRLIPEIMKELSLTLRYESNLVAHNTIAYERILEESTRYLAEATRRYSNRPSHKNSPRQIAELFQLRGHIYRKLASREINNNQDIRQELVEMAFEQFNEALHYAKMSNDYVIMGGTYLTLIEMLYVNSWAEPKPTRHYDRLALQFQRENLYQHFRLHDEQFADLRALRDDFEALDNGLISRLNHTSPSDGILKIPDGLRHYFGRKEMIFANIAFWGDKPDAVISHCVQAARYFARSSRAVYNVKHMLRQIRHLLDEDAKMPKTMAKQLLEKWKDDEEIKAIYPDLLALCESYSYIQKYMDVSYHPDEFAFEFE